MALMRASGILKTLLRTLLLVFLLWWLLHRLDAQELRVAGTQVLRHPLLLVFGLLFTCFGLLCNSVRWHRLLQQLGYTDVRFSQAVRWVWIGQFFNAFLPGACGGDLVRGWKVVKTNDKGHRAEAAASVLIDRLYGLWVLILWSASLLLIQQHRFSAFPEWRSVTWLIAFLGIGGLLTPLTVQWIPVRWSETLHPLTGRVHAAFRESLRVPGTVLTACIGSLGNLLCLTAAAHCFVLAMGGGPTLPDMLILFPTITVLTSIPITPGALGVRENLLAWLGPGIGLAAEPAVVLSLLVYFSGIVVGTIGGVFYATEQS